MNAQSTWAFGARLAATPDAEERRTLDELYAQSLARFRDEPGDARELIQIGEDPVAAGSGPAELAAMTTVDARRF